MRFQRHDFAALRQSLQLLIIQVIEEDHFLQCRFYWHTASPYVFEAALSPVERRLYAAPGQRGPRDVRSRDKMDNADGCIGSARRSHRSRPALMSELQGPSLSASATPHSAAAAMACDRKYPEIISTKRVDGGKSWCIW